jgi:chaperonin GroEL
MKERFDRYDDAVKAVACALEEGIVEGGGIALANIALNITDTKDIIFKITDALCSPNNTIINNGSEINNNNMFDQNIIDPLKVTRCALENAISVAKVILSTEAVVLNQSEWKE